MGKALSTIEHAVVSRQVLLRQHLYSQGTGIVEQEAGTELRSEKGISIDQSLSLVLSVQRDCGLLVTSMTSSTSRFISCLFLLCSVTDRR